MGGIKGFGRAGVVVEVLTDLDEAMDKAYMIKFEDYVYDKNEFRILDGGEFTITKENHGERPEEEKAYIPNPFICKVCERYNSNRSRCRYCTGTKFYKVERPYR